MLQPRTSESDTSSTELSIGQEEMLAGAHAPMGLRNAGDKLDSSVQWIHEMFSHPERKMPLETL